MTDVELMKLAVDEKPDDLTRLLILADALEESGNEEKAHWYRIEFAYLKWRKEAKFRPFVCDDIDDGESEQEFQWYDRTKLTVEGRRIDPKE